MRISAFVIALATASSFAPGALLAQAYFGIGADFGGVVRRGAWAETYGPALVSGFRVEAANKKGWVATLQAEIIYGNDVRVDPIAALRTEVGLLGDEIDRAAPVDVPLRARGFRLAALAGYQQTFGDGPLGYRALVGPAYTVHNIRIQDDAGLTTSNLRDAYKKGYDRRAGGVGGYLEAGLTLSGESREFTAFLLGTLNVFGSEPLRSVQFDLRRAAPGAGTDVALGVKLGIVTALFRPTSIADAEDIYY